MSVRPSLLHLAALSLSGTAVFLAILGAVLEASLSEPAASAPVDLSQKIADALDKYIALQKQNSNARGSQLDVNP